MDRRFLSAFTDPARIKILGRFVSPFSLLRRVQLEAVESPFVVPEKQVRPLDLLIAVKICSGETIDNLSLKDRFYLARMNAHEAYFVRQMARFAQYVLIEAWPKFWEKQSKSHDSSGMPWVLKVIASLVSNGYEESRAWTMPESQAIWLYSAFAINEGADMKVLTKDDEELIAKLEAETE